MKQPTDLLKLGNAGDMFRIAAELYCNGYSIDSENKTVVDAVIQWLDRDEGFNCEKETGLLQHFDKGLMFMGNPGTGKTTIIEICQILLRNTPLAFRKLPTVEVVDNFASKGPEYLKELKGNIFFDDLGFEKPAVHYGDKRELMQDVIFARYDCMRNNGWLTYFTTMSTKQELKDRYGEFAWSRIQQMCNRFILGGQSNSTDRRLKKLCQTNIDISKFPRLYITRQEYDDAVDRKRMKETYKKMSEKEPEPHVFKGLGTRLRESFNR